MRPAGAGESPLLVMRQRPVRLGGDRLWLWRLHDLPPFVGLGGKNCNRAGEGLVVETRGGDVDFGLPFRGVRAVFEANLDQPVDQLVVAPLDLSEIACRRSWIR